MSTDSQPTGQPTSPNVVEPEDRAIVAWFNFEGIVCRVWARSDDYARIDGEDPYDRWFEADDRSDGQAMDWVSLCWAMREFYGPEVLVREAGGRP